MNEFVNGSSAGRKPGLAILEARLATTLRKTLLNTHIVIDDAEKNERTGFYPFQEKR